MNREELATLLAHTHGAISHSSRAGPPPDPVPKSPTTTRLRDPASPLSSRQIFQSRVRTLSDDESGSQANPLYSPSSSRKSHELQHLSTLRVHVRSTTPTSPVRGSHDYGYPSRDGRFSFTPADPDFVVKERAAWNAESSDKTGHDAAEEDDRGHSSRPADADPGPPPRLSKDSAPLMHFGPSSTSGDIHYRPRTRRGPRQATNSMPGSFPESASQHATRAARRSKFNEGSMNDRSTAVSSTWDGNGPRLSEESGDHSADDTDSDATPRASSRTSRDSNSSFDVSDFQPRSTTPATIKNRLSRLGSHFKSTSEDPEKAVNEQKKVKRKGLRKSISNWNFHTLGEKMKFFGNSSHDLGDSPPKKLEDTEIVVLNDRKRKAEEVYAQQFGTKKQKSNDGVPADDKASRTSAQPRTIVKRSTSAQRTLTPSTVRHRREVSPAATRQPLDPAEILSDGDIDRRKRPTRRELEKENQHLRAMLHEKEQQRSASMVRSASKSTIHLPLKDTHASSVIQPSNPAAPAPRQATAGSFVAKQQKQHHTRSQGAVPPVPALPTRGALSNLGTGNVGNGQNGNVGSRVRSGQPGSHFGAAETGTIKRIGAGVSRPVSTILEGDENIPAGDHDVSGLEFGMLPGLRPSTRKANWQWPDDVF